MEEFGESLDRYRAANSGVNDLVARRKPMLSVRGQIDHLKSRGVTFNLYSEEDAAEYLLYSNNYLRVSSYRVLFARQVEGSNVGNYVGLDFAHLVELSRIDRRLRSALREITLDIEHFAKVKLLRLCEECGEDGYAVVSDFLESLRHSERNRLLGGLRMRAREGARSDTYLGDLIGRYIDEMPAWVFLEAVEFGSFANFLALLLSTLGRPAHDPGALYSQEREVASQCGFAWIMHYQWVRLCGGNCGIQAECPHYRVS